MKNKIFFSKWIDAELLDKKRCFCPCHSSPGVYPTTENDPCHVCQHINEFGYMPGGIRDGWVAYWRSDKMVLEDSYATE